MPVRPPARGRDSSAKACHNCRRRRLRCDRSRPTCNKCFISGQECLGYDRLFVWTQWTNQDKKHEPQTLVATASAPVTKAAIIDATVATISNNNTSPLKQQKQKKTPLAAASTIVSPDPKQQTRNLDRHLSAVNGHQLVLSQRPKHESKDSDWEERIDIHLEEWAALTSGHSSPGRSLDPLFEDFGLPTKRYLHHFYRVTKDIVAHDDLFINPFRDIIPIALTHPVLTNIIIASSAIHMANLYQSHPRDLPEDNGIGDHCIALRAHNHTANRFVLDGLLAKQRAITHMRSLLSNIDKESRNLAITAAFFFVNIELIDISQAGWKSHLEGASNLLATLSLDDETDAGPLMKNPIFDNVLANFFIYHILGSTLMPTTRCVQVKSHILNLLPVLRRTQSDSYLCCPPFILATIPKASELANQIGARPDADIINEAVALINETRNYDLKQWIASIPSVVIFNDATDREHVAASHRAAICLYVIRAIPMAAAAAPVTAEDLVGDIFMHMSLVGKDDAHFKGAAWPLFMAGAECDDTERRQWVMSRLMEMWSIVPWGYILKSVDMLRRTWTLQDAKKEAGVATKSNWLQDLWSGDYDCLIV
ncbi:hypothetical protein TD95_005196 [Thielaviopsis punctulata]|uniref:Zn(2)-C6 fungal-type domain-containing protein n=1 Tax=Thielaviopsis punctulata TaxID=72032 RepID=A0A0F4ZC15_9PEZI|nr:hypothetical protein TD95_005196 [Thielaviopsis punctulata]